MFWTQWHKISWNSSLPFLVCFPVWYFFFSDRNSNNLQDSSSAAAANMVKKCPEVKTVKCKTPRGWKKKGKRLLNHLLVFAFLLMWINGCPFSLSLFSASLSLFSSSSLSFFPCPINYPWWTFRRTGINSSIPHLKTFILLLESKGKQTLLASKNASRNFVYAFLASRHRSFFSFSSNRYSLNHN